MISFTLAQFNTWIAAFVFPLVRILAFVTAAPVFNNAAVPRRVRLAIGLVLTFAIAPTVTSLPADAPNSGIGLAILAQQVIIGLALAFVMRMVFDGVSLGGELMSFQMGLGFATLYDPQSTAQTGVVAEVVTLCSTMVFLALNGHLLMIGVLAESFRAIPLVTPSVSTGVWLNLAEMGGRIFAIGLMLSLPVLIALLITNLALAILSRAAPQLNLMAIGFPITLSVGLALLALTLPYMVPPLTRFFDEGIGMMLAAFLPISR